MTEPTTRPYQKAPYLLTVEGYRATDPLRPGRLTPVRDFHDQYQRVDLLLTEAVLTLYRAGWMVGEATMEISERLDPVTAAVHARVAAEQREQLDRAQQEAGGR